MIHTGCVCVYVCVLSKILSNLCIWHERQLRDFLCRDDDHYHPSALSLLITADLAKIHKRGESNEMKTRVNTRVNNCGGAIAAAADSIAIHGQQANTHTHTSSE